MATVKTNFGTFGELLLANDNINLDIPSDYFSRFQSIDSNWKVKSGNTAEIVLENDDGDTLDLSGDFSKTPFEINTLSFLSKNALSFTLFGSTKLSSDGEFSGYATNISISEGANSVSLQGKIYPFGEISTSSVTSIKVSTSKWSFEIKGSLKGNFEGNFSEALLTYLSVTVGNKTFSVSDFSADMLSYLKNDDTGSGEQFLPDILAGADEIRGSQGDDWLIGYQGNDKLDGGLGADTADYSDKISTVKVILNRSTDAKVYVNGAAEDTIKNIENLVGGSGGDVLTGDAANNVLDGGADRVADVIDGGAGTDTISFVSITGTTGVTLSLGTYNTTTKTTTQTVAKIGTASTDKVSNVENISGSKNGDILTGNNANNVINGGAGVDTLTGGAGSDSLYGGAGDKAKDVFDFNAIAESKAGTARDKVYDFITKTDKIDLSGIDANVNTDPKTAKAGDQAFAFNGTTAKANSVWYKVADGKVIADVDGITSTKDLVIYGDVNGDARADFEIGLVGVTSVTQGDFVL